MICLDLASNLTAQPRSQFWKERQAEFEKHEKPFADLEARWRVAFGVWLLTRGAYEKAPTEYKDVLNAVALKAASGLPARDIDHSAEPWQLWLDFMRESKWGCRPTGSSIACTEKEWDAGVGKGKSLAQVRRAERYTTGDEWKTVYERTESGTLRKLSKKEIESKSTEELGRYFHWLQDETIQNVIGSSARFCEDLSARAYEAEQRTFRSDVREHPPQTIANGETKFTRLSDELTKHEGRFVPPSATPSVNLESGAASPIRGRNDSPTKKYESRCALLAWQSLEALDHRGNQRESELTNRLAAAETAIREQLQKFKLTPAQLQRKGTKILLERKMAAVRREVLKMAVKVASEGVREFAVGLLQSQKRLGVHANLLREYTACLVIEVRARVSASPAFRKVPLLPWQKDPIARKAIRTCEEVLNERWKIGDGQPYGGAGKLSRTEVFWASVVLDWEALKEAEKIEAGPRERIPESFLRAVLSRQRGVNPGDVTKEQLYRAAADMCLHYGLILLVPVAFETCDPPRPEPASSATPQFWKEREHEFRTHDSPENHRLRAQWCSLEEYWSFSAGSGLESPAPGAVQVFKALAREAGKGLVSSRSDDPCEDWLDALRRKTDESTKQRLYSSPSATGTKTIGQTWLERMQKLGDPLPAGSMIAFVPIESSTAEGPRGVAAVEQKLFWDVTSEKVENLFTSSANLCLEFRSLAADKKATPRDTTPIVSSASAGPNTAQVDLVAHERKELLEAYKSEGQRHGVRITDKMVAEKASSKWHERTPVQRWKQNDARCTPADDVKIRAVLQKKPHFS